KEQQDAGDAKSCSRNGRRIDCPRQQSELCRDHQAVTRELRTRKRHSHRGGTSAPRSGKTESQAQNKAAQRRCLVVALVSFQIAAWCTPPASHVAPEQHALYVANEEWS